MILERHETCKLKVDVIVTFYCSITLVTQSLTLYFDELTDKNIYLVVKSSLTMLAFIIYDSTLTFLDDHDACCFNAVMKL